jgi:hypothetical protein
MQFVNKGILEQSCLKIKYEKYQILEKKISLVLTDWTTPVESRYVTLDGNEDKAYTIVRLFGVQYQIKGKTKYF